MCKLNALYTSLSADTVTVSGARARHVSPPPPPPRYCPWSRRPSGRGPACPGEDLDIDISTFHMIYH